MCQADSIQPTIQWMLSARVHLFANIRVDWRATEGLVVGARLRDGIEAFPASGPSVYQTKTDAVEPVAREKGVFLHCPQAVI